jgi:hypothetical protein
MAGHDIDTKGLAQQRMAAAWELISDLRGGTRAMRRAGTKWLPQEPREDHLAYQARLNRTYLYGAMSDTIKKLSAKPFSKPVVVKQGDTLPDQLAAIQKNANLGGKDLTQFCRSIFEDGVAWGLGHILVDFPATEGAITTLAEERASGVRPYFVRISPRNIIGAESSVQLDGSLRVTRLRYFEDGVDTEDNAEKPRRDIRVITPDAWELWQQKGDSKKYVLAKSGRHTFGRVPLVTFYTGQVGAMEAEPPLEDLAWLNLAHWQSMSDQRNILRFARVGILFGSGFTEEEYENGITIGPSNLVISTDPQADLKYVEHSGKAIGAGKEDLEALEARMEVLGLQPLMKATGGETATARAMGEARTHSSVQAWITSLANAMEEAYGMAAEWVKVALPDDFAVDIFNDFGVMLTADADHKTLLDMKARNLITHRTYLAEVKRRGLLADEVNVDAEIDAVGKEEADELDRVGGQPDQDQDQE